VLQFRKLSVFGTKQGPILFYSFDRRKERKAESTTRMEGNARFWRGGQFGHATREEEKES